MAVQIQLPDALERRLMASGVRIPSLPHAAAQAIQMGSNPDVSLKQMAKVMEADPGLSAEILRVANSSFYRGTASQGISNINRALTTLGVREVQRICLSVAVVGAFPVKSAEPTFDRALFWKHSACCAMAARKLCEHLKVNFDGEEFVVGLLHDVGKLVLDLVAHEEMSRAIAATHETGISMRHAEQEVFGVDHAEVSGWMCQRWNLPEDLVDAVRFHHDPGKAEFNRMLAAVVYLADGIARVAGNGFGGETTPITIEETDAWRILAPKVPPDIDLAFLYFEIQDTMARHSGLLTGGNG